MKIAAVHCRLFPGGALEEYIIPYIFNGGITDRVAEAIKIV